MERFCWDGCRKSRALAHNYNRNSLGLRGVSQKAYLNGKRITRAQGYLEYIKWL